MVLDWITRKVNVGGRGIQWMLTERLRDIDFADRLLLICQRTRDMAKSSLSTGTLNAYLNYADQTL